MRCAWKELLEILPRQFRQDVEAAGGENLQEIRLRLASAVELRTVKGSIWLSHHCTKEDIQFCIQAASKYSPWTASSMRKGYLTSPGGHRLGLCGQAIHRDGICTGHRDVFSVCIRVARDYPGISAQAPKEGSVLILGAPGWGKTTLLRDLIRQRSYRKTVAVVDERGELFPEGFDRGLRTDVLRGCRKGNGIEQVLRTMGPECIAVDEITAEEDCRGLIQAAGCGVTLLATAHAGSIAEFAARPVYAPILEKNLFSWILMMRPNQTYAVERIDAA